MQRNRNEMNTQAAVWLLLLAVGLFVASADDVRAGDRTRERNLKAAFVYNFTKFIEWPDATFNDASSPLIIGVMGSDSFLAAQAAAVEGRKLNHRPFLVTKVDSAQTAQASHVVFVSREAKTQSADILAALKDLPVLTVGESDEFLQTGGIINLVLEEGKIRFDVNQRAARRGGLRVNAQLLKLARKVSQ
jgi:hypothetical protein